MIPTQRPRILVASSNAPLQARLIAQLAARYELVTPAAAGGLTDIALAVVDESGWHGRGETSASWPVIVVRAGGGASPPGADASVRAEFEPEELSERIETHLTLARLRASAATKESALADKAGEAQEALRRHEAEQAVILDTVRAMIWYKDASNRVLRCNRAAAQSVGKTVAEIEGRRVEELFPAERARAYHRNDLEVIASGRPKIGELEELSLRGGRKCWVQRDTLPYRDALGAIVGVVVIAVDVTVRKRAEDLAAAKERAEREFVANVSHEFRTPVAAIKGFAQTLRDGAWRDEADRERFLGIIEANADRLNALVGDLLTMSQLEGSKPRSTAAADAHRVARDCVKDLSSRAKRKNLNVYVAVPRRLRVRMEPDHLAQALTHLLDNAIKFTPPGGWIRLGASSSKRTARILVEDSGIGIPSTHLPRVFDRFFRVMKGAQPGSPGVGLHLVKKLVEAYGGSASVRSRLGRGSAFRLTLPAAKRPNQR